MFWSRTDKNTSCITSSACSWALHKHAHGALISMHWKCQCNWSRQMYWPLKYDFSLINSTPKHTFPDFLSVTLSELKYMYDELNTICTIVFLSASLNSDRSFVVVLVQYTMYFKILFINVVSYSHHPNIHGSWQSGILIFQQLIALLLHHCCLLPRFVSGCLSLNHLMFSW